MTSETLQDRIRWALEKKGMRDLAELADAAGVARESVYRWIKRGEIGRQSSLNVVSKALGVAPHWLATGEGTPDVSPAPSEAPTRRQPLFSALDFVHNLNQVLELDLSLETEVEEGWRVAEKLHEYRADAVGDLPSDVQQKLASQIGKRSHKKTTR